MSDGYDITIASGSKVTGRRKNNWAATRAPGPADDDSQGYEVGSYWLDVLAEKGYRCKVATTGQAKWLAADGLSHSDLTDLEDPYDHPQYSLVGHTHAGGGGAPVGVDYLVGTADATLTNEIVVGTTPGGELGGTWASPTVDATHSGSAHHTEDHQARHNSGGADALKLDDLAAPDDNTDLNASLTAHGLLLKLGGGTTNFLRADGTWAAPPSGGAPTTVDYLVGTADATLTNEIVVGTTPGGELGGTWASPTVDATHSGSAHHAEAHVIDTSGPHTLSGGTVGDVLRVSGATTAVFATLAHGDLSDAPTDAHHAEAHTVASTGPHAQSGLTVGHVLRASAAAAFDFAALQDGDIPTTHAGSAHHAQAHDIEGADHTLSGAAAGEVARASGATTWSFAPLQDSDIPATHSGSAHHGQSHDHSAAGDGTTLSPATLNLPGSTTPAQTAEGQVVWDTDTDVLTIGDATARKTFGYMGSTNPTTQDYSDSPAPGTSVEMARIDHVHGMPAAGSGAPSDADYLVGTTNAGLSNEIVVGTTPGGELGGTWASPTVDATHSGSAHHNQSHAIDGGDHTASGLTTGHYMRATGATTFAFQAIAEGDLPASVLLESETPGGELGGTWASPTVDATHSGSAHHDRSHDHSAAGDGQNLAPVTIDASSTIDATGQITGDANIVARGELRSKDNAAGDNPGVVGIYNPLNPAVADTKGGDIDWWAKDTGGTDRPIARIFGDVASNDGVNSMGTRMRFATRSTGDTDLVNRWQLNNGGDFVPLSPGTYKLGSTGNPVLELIAGEHSDTATDTGRLDFYRRSSAGGAVADNYILGHTRYYGDDGTGDLVGASIRALVDGTVATNQMPTELLFATNSGAASPTDRWRIAPAGHFEPSADSAVNIGTASIRPATIYADNLNSAGAITLGAESITEADWTDLTDGGATTLHSHAGGGAPIDADYLVGTANGTLTNEIVVGTSPGGELGNTWASPTVDATHSGSSHSNIPAQTGNLTLNSGIDLIFAADSTSEIGSATSQALVVNTDKVLSSTGHLFLDATAGNQVIIGDAADYVRLDGQVGGVLPYRADAVPLGNETWKWSSVYGGPLYSDTATGGNIQVRRNDAAITAGEILGIYYFAGKDTGSVWRTTAAIRGESREAWGNNANLGTAIEFWTTPTASATLTQQWEIDPSGDLLPATSSKAIGSDGFRPDVNLGNFDVDGATPVFHSTSPPTLTINDDVVTGADNVVGTLAFGGNNEPSGYIVAEVRAVNRINTPAVGDSPGSLQLRTTSDGAGGPTTRWEVREFGDLLPAVDSTYDIGSSTLRPAEVYSDLFVAPRLDSQAADLYLDANAGSQIYIGQSADYVRPQAHTLPGTDDALDLGATTWRWAHVWASDYVAVKDTDASGDLYLQRENTTDGVLTGEQMGNIYVSGEDSAGTVNAQLAILGIAAENHTASARGSYFVVQTTATGATARTSRWQFNPAGHLLPWADETYDIGTPTTRARAVYAKAPVVNVYTSNSTWTKPSSPEPAYIVVEVIGGGGGGGGSPSTGSGEHAAAGGGGAGGFGRKLVDVSTLSSNGTVTVGTGGAGGTGANNGSDGNASSFAATGMTTVSAGGGTGGLQGVATSGNNTRTGGTGGSTTGGDLNARGGMGKNGIVAGGVRVANGDGGESAIGGSTRPSTSNGVGGYAYGGGGSGANRGPSSGTANGGAGATGVVVVTEYYA